MKDNLYSKLEGILYNYKNIQQEVNNLKLEIDFIQSSYKGCGAIGYEERTGETYKITNQVEEEILRKEKMIEQLNRELCSKELIIKKIDNALKILSDKEKEIIKMRYTEGQGKVSWFTISEQTYLSQSRCYQIKDQAIKKIIPIVFISKL